MFKPVKQTKYNNEGNCLSACIASLFKVDIKDVPTFDDGTWVGDFSNWMAERFGRFVVYVDLLDSVEWCCDSLMITVINSTNPKVKRHAVISKGTRIVFDPMIGEVDMKLVGEMEPEFLIIGYILGCS